MRGVQQSIYRRGDYEVTIAVTLVDSCYKRTFKLP